jgi:hypothetical protein
VSHRTARVLAWTVLVVTTALLVAAYVLEELSPVVDQGQSWSSGGVFSVLYGLTVLAFPAVGALLAARRPGNAIGWLLLAIGLAWVVANASSYSDYGLLQHPGSLPGAAVVAPITSAFWVPPIGLSGTFLILLFPDGHLLTRRWRWVAWLSAFAIVAGTLILMVTPGPMKDAGYPHTTNPLGGPSSWRGAIDAGHLLVLLLPLSMALSALSLVLRFRRSHGAYRQQIKWLAAAAALVASFYAIVEPLSAILVPSSQDAPRWLAALQDLALCSFGLIPIAIGVAVMRYRLYEIDRLISRTISYAIVTGLLGGLFLGLVVLSTDALPLSSPVVVAASTLLVAALFNPLRRRVQHAVDRRFNRSSYDAELIVGAFTGRLRDAVDLDSVTSQLLVAVAQSLEPSSATLWLRQPDPR